jgi:hypothetical protein
MGRGLHFINEQQAGFRRDENTQIGREVRNSTSRIVRSEVIRQFRTAFHIKFNQPSPVALSKVPNKPRLTHLSGTPQDKRFAISIFDPIIEVN